MHQANFYLPDNGISFIKASIFLFKQKTSTAKMIMV
jgi:hypothetical protein